MTATTTPQWCPADLALLDALARTHIVSLGSAVEAVVEARDGSTYRVRVGPGPGSWACSCPNAVYRRHGSGSGRCKHAKALALVAQVLPPTFNGGSS